MSFISPLLCDRRVYDKKGKWQNPNNDLTDTIFYFIQTPRTLAHNYDANGREELSETMTIVVFGNKPIIKGDEITLDTGEKFRAGDVTLNYFEPNILIKDMLKPRVESLQIDLE